MPLLDMVPSERGPPSCKEWRLLVRDRGRKATPSPQNAAVAAGLAHSQRSDAEIHDCSTGKCVVFTYTIPTSFACYGYSDGVCGV
jgi:hypothetical protein